VYLFYNLGPGRSSIRISQELRGMASMRPRVIGLVEAIGYPLPDLPDYRRVRDTTRPSRANVAAYVRRDLTVKSVKWHDLSQTWPRTEMPGTHPPRSILELRVNGSQVIVYHAPPQTKHPDSFKGQQEGIAALTRLMAPGVGAWSKKRPRVALMDANRRPGEPGPGPDKLAAAIDGTTRGTRIDCAVTRKQPVDRVLYRRHVPGAELGSDHKWGALQIVLPEETP
jgi:hypothetical protein